MPESQTTFEKFVDVYGPETPVQIEDLTMTIAQALQFERKFCKADPEDASAPEKRIRWMAGKMAAAGVPLLPEHQVFLEAETD